MASWIDFSSQQEPLPLTHWRVDKQLPGHSCDYPPKLWPNPSRKKSKFFPTAWRLSLTHPAAWRHNAKMAIFRAEVRYVVSDQVI
jgi:hypothetical protein